MSRKLQQYGNSTPFRAFLKGRGGYKTSRGRPRGYQGYQRYHPRDLTEDMERSAIHDDSDTNTSGMIDIQLKNRFDNLDKSPDKHMDTLSASGCTNSIADEEEQK